MRNTETLLLIVFIFTLACQAENDQAPDVIIQAPDSVGTVKEENLLLPPPINYDTTEWVELIRLIPSAIIDLKYATPNNFVKEKMYDCGRCFVRPEVGKTLQRVAAELANSGFKLVFFDCYRPRPIQWKLWNKVPDPRYVADPRKGSMHNRGSAVDLTIATNDGIPLDMGTPFDYFGPKAYHDYKGLPDEVITNRKFLKNIMEKYHFRPTRTEWWHYSYKPKSYAIADMVWKCALEQD